MDRLTGLPDVLIEKILLNIPTFDVVRTCVLSKHWQYKWTMLPKLVLDVSFFLQARYVKEEPPFDYVHIVNTLLVQHEGPLQEFCLAIPDLPCPQRDYISQAIRTVMMKSIKKIAILKWGTLPYSWPLSLSLSQSLTYLELRNCRLKPEPFSRGFQGLTCLVIYDVQCDAGTLSNCIYNSPNLEEIILENLDFGAHTLIIYAPKLEWLFVRGVCKCIYLPQANNLREMEMRIHVSQFQCWDESHLIHLFGNLSVLESLSLGADIYPLFFGLEKALPSYLGQLRVFRLTDVEFWNKDVLHVFFCIIHSSPCLQRLDIIGNRVCYRRREMRVRLKMYEDITLAHLKKVNIGPISGTHNELSVIKYLLQCSPALQEMAIWNTKWPDCKAFSTALARFYRASPTVKIVFRDSHYNVLQTLIN